MQAVKDTGVTMQMCRLSECLLLVFVICIKISCPGPICFKILLVMYSDSFADSAFFTIFAIV